MLLNLIEGLFFVQMGINFADEREAQVALEIIKEKAAKFKARKSTGLVVKVNLTRYLNYRSNYDI